MGWVLRVIAITVAFTYIALTCAQIRHSIIMNASEDAEVGSTIGMLSSQGGSGGDTSYIAIDGVPIFNIEKNGKVVVAKTIDLESLCQTWEVCCSYSQPCQLPYTVMVEDSAARDMRQINLQICILDVNDNLPRFQQPMGQIVRIPENSPIGTAVDTEPAIDGDWSVENQIQRYTLQGAEVQQYFEIDNSDLPHVRLKLREQLDYEAQTTFKGFLEACDRHNCTTTSLRVDVVDVNDNVPFFHPPLEHNLTLLEDTPIGKIILSLNATDRDSPTNARMRFELISSEDPSIPSTFHLNQTTGALSLARRLQADVRLNYNFKVRVKETSEASPVGIFERGFSFNDFRRPDMVSINIRVEDINDFAPDIRMVSPAEGTNIRIPENVPPGRIVTMSVVDKDLGDNGRVRCRLENGENSFQLREIASGVYTLHSLRSFDAELEPNFSVNITCIDKGTPQPRSTQKQIVIHIDDDNEFEPVFTKKEYSAKISENVPNNTFVLQVMARDEDYSAQLEYSLKGDGERYFKIDPSTGKITTHSDMYQMNNLDRELTPEVTFFVIVKDATWGSINHKKSVSQTNLPVIHTAQTTVTVELIDENDNAPSFTDIGPFYISENRLAHTKVNGHLHAEDPDEGFNGKVKYNLQDVWDSANQIRKYNIFQLDESSGTIRTLEPLDREQTPEYTLRVVACDMAPRDTLCTRVNITVSVVDINDNPPEWLFPVSSGADGGVEESVNVTVDAAAGQVVAQLVAHDRDVGQNGKVNYALHDPHNEVAFAVNATTGQVTVTNRYYSGLAETSSHQKQHQSSLQPGLYRLRIRASDMGHPPMFSDTWLLIRVVGTSSGIFGIHTGLLVLLVLVTLIIAISLVGAIICIRRQTSFGGKASSTQPVGGNCFAGKSHHQYPSTPNHMIPLSYHHHHPDYPTFYKHNGGRGTAYVLAKTVDGVTSSDPLQSSPGVCPITDMGVTEFFAPYGLTPGNSQADEQQTRFLEVDPVTGGATYLSLLGGDTEEPVSPGVRLVSAYPVNYNTCASGGRMPTASAVGMLKFRQTSGSPEFRYYDHGDVFELPEGSMNHSGPGSADQHMPPTQHQSAALEQFEGCSADSGRGVSEDEPAPHIVHCSGSGSSDCLPVSHMSTFFCQGTGSLVTAKNDIVVGRSAV